jgi:L-ascorbate metabolism protein UlaG (beta-lactamase superfamily)
VLIDVEGHRILTDPALTPRLGHLVRRHPCPEVGHVDTVLISHLHMDHLHRPSLKQVADGARLVIPRGAARLVGRVGSAQVDEVRPGDSLTVPAAGGRPAVEIETVVADHSGRRGPYSRAQAEPIGYVIRAGGTAVYFAGDTDLHPAMASLGTITVALLPIWGWGPTLGERHLDPQRAASATEIIEPEAVVPVHWGTYSPVRVRRGPPGWLDTPLDRFRSALRSRGLDDRLVGLPPGGSLVVGGGGPDKRRPSRSAAASEVGLVGRYAGEGSP